MADEEDLADLELGGGLELGLNLHGAMDLKLCDASGEI